MLVHLKRGEKLYVNGAVLRVDRRTSLEFLNDVTFLLENHVMQADDASTPIRQLYFVIQTMIMDPANASMTETLYRHMAHRVRSSTRDEGLLELLDTAERKIAESRYFDALKHIRLAFTTEENMRPDEAHDSRKVAS